MKLSELRPCDHCDGPINPSFYVLDMSLAMLSPRAVQEVLGMNQFFGGRALGLAEVFAPSAEDAVVVTSDKDPSLRTRLFICQQCYLFKQIDLAMLTERVREKEKRTAATTAPQADGDPRSLDDDDITA